MRSMNETQNARLMEVLRSICLFYLKLDLSEQLSVTRPYGMSDDEQTPLELLFQNKETWRHKLGI